MDKIAEEEEKNKIMDKIFACAMAPVAEWIAGWLDIEPQKLLPDYNDYADKLAFNVNVNGESKSCLGYLEVLPCDTNRQWSEEFLKEEDSKKAASMLLDGAVMIWKTLFANINDADKDIREELFGIWPEFDQTKMCFKIAPVNRVKIRWHMATEQIKKINEENARLTQIVLKAEQEKNIELINKILEEIGKLEELEKKANAILDGCTEETNKAEEERIASVKEEMNQYDYLYLVCEYLDELSDDERFEEALERLPALSVQYKDPDEENEIDKLKKEINF